MNKAPEQIWVYSYDDKFDGDCDVLQEHCCDGTQYTNTDVSQAMVAAAYEAALSVGGMHIGFNSEGEPDGSYCTVEPNDPIGMSLWIKAERIRALTPTDAKAALDRIVQEAVKEALEKAANVAEGVALPMDGKNAKAQADYMRDVISQSIRALKGGEA